MDKAWRQTIWTSTAASKSIYLPLATDNLLENNVVPIPHHCSLGTAACYLLVMLTCAVLMTSSHSVGFITAVVAQVIQRYGRQRAAGFWWRVATEPNTGRGGTGEGVPAPDAEKVEVYADYYVAAGRNPPP